MWQLKSAFHTFGLCLKEKCNQVRFFRFKKRGYAYTDSSQQGIKAISGTDWRPVYLLAWHCAVLASLASLTWAYDFRKEKSLPWRVGQLRNVYCYYSMNYYFFSFNFAVLNLGFQI